MANSRRRASAFVPWRIPNMVQFLDAESSPFTYSSGAEVSQWDDLSVAAHHASQGTVGKQPTRVANVCNGRHGIKFTAANSDLLVVSDHSDLDGAQTTYCISAIPNASPANSNSLLARDGANNPAFIFEEEVSGSHKIMGKFVKTGPTEVTCESDTTVCPTGVCAELIWRYDQTNFSAYVDGVKVKDTAETAAPIADTSPFIYGAGSLTDTVGQVTEGLTCIIIYSRAISVEEILKIHRFLHFRWG